MLDLAAAAAVVKAAVEQDRLAIAAFGADQDMLLAALVAAEMVAATRNLPLARLAAHSMAVVCHHDAPARRLRGPLVFSARTR